MVTMIGSSSKWTTQMQSNHIPKDCNDLKYLLKNVPTCIGTHCCHLGLLEKEKYQFIVISFQTFLTDDLGARIVIS